MNEEIIHRKDTERGRFYFKDNDMLVGCLSYIWADGSHLLIDFAKASAGYESKGVIKRLLCSLADYARENNCKLIPLSSHVRLICAADKSFADLI